MPQIYDEGKLKNESPQTKSPEPQAATGGGGDNRASLAKRSVLRWVCCRVGSKEDFAGSVLECGVRVCTVVSFDEEKPPCRAVQGGAGKHRGESEAYTNLAGGLKVDSPGQRGGLYCAASRLLYGHPFCHLCVCSSSGTHRH